MTRKERLARGSSLLLACFLAFSAKCFAQDLFRIEAGVEIIPGDLVDRTLIDGIIDDPGSYYHFVPEVVDWNNDGYADIICGYFQGSGYVALLPNPGVHGSTNLSAHVPVEADSEIISHSGST